MFTVLIRDNGEASVTRMTYESIFKELKDIPESKVLIVKDWFKAVGNVKTKWVCLVEADCLVNSGYFTSLAGYIKKNPQLGKMGVLTTSTAVNNWAVKFYGYSLGDNHTDGIIPNKEKKATSLPFYTMEIAYIPGAVIRTGMLEKILAENKRDEKWDDLVYFSTLVSIGFWTHNWQIYLAHNSTYCTTEGYVNDIKHYKLGTKELVDKFATESI